MLKQNKGITLVALVITIIVLLILAGVSISLVVGDNGVLTRASDSSSKTKIGQMQEALQIAMSDVQTEYFANYAANASASFGTSVNQRTLAKALENQGFYLFSATGGSATTAATVNARINGTSGAATEFSDSDTILFIADDDTGTNCLQVAIKMPTSTSKSLTTTYLTGANLKLVTK